MEDAANKIVSLSSDPNFISELERQQIQEYARNYALEKAEERGKKTGINEGKQLGIDERNIEIAKKSLEQNIDINTISTITGLSIEEINKLIV